MKKSKPMLLFFSLGLIILMSSCQTEGCTDPLALNYNPDATKDNASCIYPEPEPEPDIREPYIGNYLVTDSLFMLGEFNSVKEYTLSVSLENTVADTIYLKNLWGDANSYYAILNNSSFNIPSQQVSGPYHTTGNGNICNRTITYETSGDVYLHKGHGSKQ